MRVGRKNRFPALFLPSEGTDQHKQRGLWEMKVSDKPADDLEFVTWTKKNTGLPRVGFNRLACSNLCAMLKGARCSRTGGDDASTRG